MYVYGDFCACTMNVFPKLNFSGMATDLYNTCMQACMQADIYSHAHNCTHKKEIHTRTCTSTRKYTYLLLKILIKEASTKCVCMFTCMYAQVHIPTLEGTDQRGINKMCVYIYMYVCLNTHTYS